MSFQFYNPAPVFFTLSGLAPANGGSLAFYDPGTTDFRNTWSNPGLTVLNENPVPLDSAGRSETAIWLDGAYDVVLRDGDGATVWTRRIQPEAEEGTAIPALVDGQFLSNDGTNLLWQPVAQLPDPDGSEGYFLVVTGGIPTWVAPAAAPEGPEIDVAASSVTIGDNSTDQRWFVQDGTGTVPASGGRTSSLAVTFPTAFVSTPRVMVVPTVNGITPNGYNAVAAVTSRSPTGFTIQVDVNSDQGGTDISTPVTFDWIAFGRLAASA